MRDLLFKNLTSEDKRRKVIASSEVMEKKGIRSIIHRHFICFAKEIKTNEPKQPLPYVYILKERDTKQHIDRFFCKIKGSMVAASNGKLFLILFMHTLKINLIALPQLYKI